AAPDACEHGIGLAPRELRHLHRGLATDHRLEIAHHHRVRMGSGNRADDVESILDVGYPVAHRLVESILERPGPALHRNHRCTQQLHAIDVLYLAPDVLRAHVHDALHAEAGGDGSRRDAVHAGASLRNYTLLAHTPRKQRLADHVVDLVRAGMVQILALDIDLGPPQMLGPAPRVIHRSGPADVVL